MTTHQNECTRTHAHTHARAHARTRTRTRARARTYNRAQTFDTLLECASFVDAKGSRPSMADIRCDKRWEAERTECMRLELKLAREAVCTCL